MANGAIRQWYPRKVVDAASAHDLRVALKQHLQFLAPEQGTRNPTVLASLRQCRSCWRLTVVLARSSREDSDLEADEHGGRHSRESRPTHGSR